MGETNAVIKSLNAKYAEIVKKRDGKEADT